MPGWLKDVADVDRAIERCLAEARTAHPRSCWLIQHSQQPSKLGLFKECYWSDGPLDASYKNADSRAGIIVAQNRGYVPTPLVETVESPKRRAALIGQLGLRVAEESILVLRPLREAPAKALATAYRDFVSAEQRLRQAMARADERTNPIGRFWEVAYARMFEGELPANRNQPGYDVVVPVRGDKPVKVQVKHWRKASGNASSGVDIRLHKKHPFDRVAIFFLDDDGRVTDFVELTLVELRAVTGSRTKNPIQLRREHVASHLAAGRRTLRAKARKAGLDSLLALSAVDRL